MSLCHKISLIWLKLSSLCLGSWKNRSVHLHITQGITGFGPVFLAGGGML
uniref:Uncharacterized protein n=1 Tax=Physcomitrium patens TaxID=3218 RepID=A0A2K1IN58_PHYPA|nr:hypothetical protein PHYPA_027027 [Physcomitrium patens]